MLHRFLLVLALCALVVPALIWACPAKDLPQGAGLERSPCCCPTAVAEPAGHDVDDDDRPPWPCFCAVAQRAPSAAIWAPVPSCVVVSGEVGVRSQIVAPPVPVRVTPLPMAIDPGGGWLADQRCIRLLL